MTDELEATMLAMKPRPFCAEQIQAAALVCRHCRRDLIATPTGGNRWATFGIVCGVVALLLPVVGLVGLISAAYAKSQQERLTPVAFTVLAVGTVLGLLIALTTWA